MEIRSFNGLRNVTSPERFKNGDLAVALDVELDNTKRILTRRGQTLKNPTALNSLYANHIAAVAVNGSTLVAIENDFSLTTVAALSTTDRVSYDTYNDTVYFSNGTDVGRLVGRTYGLWGVVPPTGQPAATATTGNLPAGTYLYAVTFVRSDGHESGTPIAGSIYLPTGGGIRFTGIEVSSNPEVDTKVMYLSTGNGEQLFKAGSLPNSQTTATYAAAQLDLTIPLITQFAQQPPAGTLVRNYNGMNYVVVGGTVYYSDPYNLELFRLDTNFLQFPGKVVLFEAVNDGIFVATADTGGEDAESIGTTWFLPGGRPDQMKSAVLFDYGAVEYSGVKTDAAYFDSEAEGENAGEKARPAVVWTSRHGVIAGFDGGATQNLTETRYSFPVSARGAALVKQARGFVQYIVTLQDPGAANNAYTEVIS